MNVFPTKTPDYAVAVLAGGRGSRLGGVDKGLLPAGGQTAVQRVLAAIPEKVPRVIIANRNLDRYRRFGLPVRQDPWPDYRGPLAGILAALYATGTSWVQILPCDGLSLPPDLSAILLRAAADSDAPAAFPHCDNRGQYTCCVVHRDLTQSLERALENGERRLGRWLCSAGALAVKFEHIRQSPIWSANTVEEWRTASWALASQSA